MKRQQSATTVNRRKKTANCFQSSTLHDVTTHFRSTIAVTENLTVAAKAPPTQSTSDRQSENYCWQNRVPFLMRYSPLALAVCAILTAGPAMANPQGGQVVAGQAHIEQTSAGRLDVIQNSDKAIIDWKDFSIDKGEQTHFQQPSASSMALNRVYGGQQSVIEGQLSANGRVLLINPNGVLFDKNASVNVGSLIATTSDIDNAKFMADGQLAFDKNSTDPNASVVNRGQIEVTEGGAVVLAAPSVSNEGSIKARLGQVVLAGSEHYTLDFNGDGLLRFDIGDQAQSQDASSTDSSDKPAVSNSGVIVADGGVVQMTARVADTMVDKVINMDGVVQAQSVQEHNGTIVLSGGDNGIVAVSGTLDASGSDPGETGGDVKILGEKVGVFDGSEIDVSGDQAGGTILIGGNYQGQGPEPNAQRTVVSQDAHITADAVTEGDGGKVVVWADEITSFKGNIQAKGGTEGGNGGFVEVSGKKSLNFQGEVDLKAEQGAVGTLLLDPDNIYIQQYSAPALVLYAAVVPAAAPVTYGPNDSEILDNNNILAADYPVPPDTDFYISEQAVELLPANANVIFQANDNIEISNLADGVLSFQASTGSVIFTADFDNDLTGSLLFINSTIETQGGNVRADAFDIQGSSIVTNGGDITLHALGYIVAYDVINSSHLTNGGNISLTSDFAAVYVSDVDSSATATTGTGIAGNIYINSPLSTLTGTLPEILTGSINATGRTRGGHVTLTSGGDIRTNSPPLAFAAAAILPAYTISTSSSNGVAGNVDLNADREIEVGDIITTGLISSGNINLQGNQSVLINSSTLDAGSGNITLTSDQINLASSQIISGNGTLTIQPFTPTLNFTLGGTDGVANYLANPELAMLQDGFSEIFFGRSNGSGKITVDAGGISLNDNSTIRTPNGTGTLAVNGSIQTNGNDLSLLAGDRVTQTGGTIQTGGLGIEAAGVDLLAGNTMDRLAIHLTGATNAFAYSDTDNLTVGTVGTLSGITLNNGNLSLTANGTLAIDQALAGIDALTLTATDLSLAADVTANSALLTATNTIDQTAGTLQTTSLGVDAAAAAFASVNDVATLAVNLTGANNPFAWIDLNDLTIGTVGSLSGVTLNNGNLNLTANGTLTINQTLAGINALTLTATDVSLAANVTANSTLLTTTNAINQTVGTLQTTSLGVDANSATFASVNDVTTLAVNLTGANNPFAWNDLNDLSIGTVGTLSGITLNNGNLSLTANGTLAIDQALAGIDALTLTATDLSLAAEVTANSALLTATNTIDQTAGTLQTTSLGVDAAAAAFASVNDVATLAVNLTGANNPFAWTDLDDLTVGTVGTLSGITLNNGNLNLTANGTLAINQALTGIDALTLTAADLSLAANVTANSTLLMATNAINQTGRTLQTTSLGVDASSAAFASVNDVATLAVNLTGANNPFTWSDSTDLAIGTVGSLSGVTLNNGNLSLTANGTLAINQALAGIDALTLTATDVSLATDVTANSALLTATNAINQTGGTLQSNNLGMDAASVLFSSVNDVNTLAVNLSGANNPFAWTDLNDLSIGTVGTLSGIILNNGNLSLTANGTLAINQALAGINALTLTAANVTLAADVTANSALLTATSAINQTAGTLQTASLGVDANSATFASVNDVATLAVNLTGANNPFAWPDLDDLSVGTVGTLSGIILNNGNLNLTANGSLAINQALAGIDALTLTAADVTLAADVTANSALLTATNAINQTAGTLQSNNLGMDAASVLFSSVNDVNTLAVALSGANNPFAWTDLNDLAIGTVGILSGISLNNGNLDLTANGTLAINQALAGINALTLTAANVTLAADVTANSALLTATNAVNQTGGTLQTTSLGIDASSASFASVNDVNTLAVNLSGANNPFAWTDLNDLSIGTVGTLSGIILNNGNLSLTANGTLAINQALAGINALTLTAANVTLAADVTANSALLTATNAINQTAGTLQTASLGVDANSATFASVNDVATLAVNLTGANNPFTWSDSTDLAIGTVGTLSGITLNNGNLSLTANGTLAINQALAGIDALTLSAADVSLAAHVTANDTLLTATNTINQTTGTLQTTTLGVDASSVAFASVNDVATLAVNLTGANNPFAWSDSTNLAIGTVETLSGISLNNGDLNVTANGTLAINQALAGIDALTLSAADVSLAAHVTANDTLLTATNTINQTTGTLQTTTLGVDANSATFASVNDVATLAVNLTGANNPFAWTDLNDLSIGTVGTLSGITLNNGNLNLTASGNLLINQALTDIDALTLNATNLTLAGNTTAQTTLLNASNDISQSNGIIQSPRLGVQAATATFLENNLIDTLAVQLIGTDSNFAFTDPDNLTVGTVGMLSGITLNNGDLHLTATGSLAVNGALSGIDALTLNAADLLLAADVTATSTLLNANAISQSSGTRLRSSGLGIQAGDAIFRGDTAVDTLAVRLNGSGNAFVFTDSDNLTIGTVGTLAGITLNNGDLTLTATNQLSVEQALVGIDALTVNATNLAIDANVTATSTLLNAYAISQSSGTRLQSSGLGIQAGDAIFWGDTAVDTLAMVLTEANAPFAFTDPDSLIVGTVGTLSGITLNNGDLSLTANGNLLISQPIVGVRTLDFNAPTISTFGISTNGSQTYDGNLQLGGDFETSNGNFSVSGDSTLTDHTNLLISGDVTFNNIVGNYDLSIIAIGGGDVTFNTDIGTINSLFVSADIINLHDVTTNGRQSYNGTVISHSDYLTNGAPFVINGDSSFLSDTFIDTSGGLIQFNGTVNGSNSITLASGNTGNILFNGDVNIVDALNISSANDITVQGALAVPSMTAVYQGDFTTGPAGFLNVGSLYINPTAQLADISGEINGVSGEDASLQVEGPIGNDLFIINGCTIGIPCQIPPAARPRYLQFEQMLTAIGYPEIIPTIFKTLAQHRPPSMDPTQYQFSNLGNEELWDNQTGAYSVSSFAVFTKTSAQPETVNDKNKLNED